MSTPSDTLPATLPPRSSHANLPAKDKRILQGRFLMALRETGQIKKSADMIGLRVATVYEWAQTSDVFAKTLEEAQKQGEKSLLANLEQDLDDVVADRSLIQYTSNLRMFRMKRLDPRYKDNVQVNLETKGPTQLIFEVHTTTGSGSDGQK